MKSEKCLPDEIASRSTLLAPHCSLHTPRFTLHAPRSTLHILTEIPAKITRKIHKSLFQTNFVL